MKKNSILLIFLIATSLMNCYSQEKNDTLVRLVNEANEEMGIASEELNKWFIGETLESIKKNHLEIQNDSVTYVCVSPVKTIELLNDLTDLKERQLEVFMYIDLNPCFSSLVEYLINNNLAMYQIFTTNDKKHCTHIIKYTPADLKLFSKAIK